MNKNRRKFIKRSGQSVLALSMGGMLSYPLVGCSSKPKKAAEAENELTSDLSSAELFFNISLAQWSLNRSLFSGKLDNLKFAEIAKTEFDISAVEYVNQFFKDKANDTTYLNEMKKRAEDNGVKSVLIMIDGEGHLGELDDKERNKAVENHYKWVDAAKLLGCHAIRVNAGASSGTAEEVKQAAVQGLGKLTEYGASNGISIIVENHGGYSSNGMWLADVIGQVDHDKCGTLPDFGNFCIEYHEENGERVCDNRYDMYKGMQELMPYAKGVSAKAYNFDEEGNETSIDFLRMMRIIKNANFSGYIGLEYEGEGEEYQGIKALKDLVVKTGKQVS